MATASAGKVERVLSRPEAARRTPLRRDIQGLRAVAILGVVAYHAGVPHSSGGYVGVDVFFVISGYLITGLLMREVDSSGRVRFSSFYARRARRLLPSAALVIVATMLASAMVLPPLRAAATLRDGLSAALYFANYRFALQATDYLTAGAAPSPFLHFWSLGVEEQFYLLWPVLLALAAVLGRRMLGRRVLGPRAVAAVLLASLAVASFGLSLWLTQVAEPWAFFSLPSRAWELGAGGLLAIVRPWTKRAARPAAAAIGWCGIGAVVWTMSALPTHVPFPGTAALLPVIGTMAVIAAGEVPARGGPAAALAWAPLQGVGRVSYTWYLWHWPALILAPVALHHSLGLGPRLAVAGAALVAAAATTVLVEEPSRHLRRLGEPRFALGLVAGTGAGVATATFVAVSILPPTTGSGRVVRSALGPRTASHSAGGESAATVAAALTHEVQAAVARSMSEADVPANVTPPLAAAQDDEPAPYHDGCFNGFLDDAVHPCLYGNPTGARTVVLFGDSHALMWFPAIDAIATAQGWRLVLATKATCAPVDVAFFSPDLGRSYTGCDRWRSAEMARIAAMHPDLVLLSFSRAYGHDDHVLMDGPAWLSGLAEVITDVRSAGARVVVIGDAPYPIGFIPDCLAGHLTDASACAASEVPPHVDVAGIAREQQTTAATGAGFVDALPWFCWKRSCAAMVDGIVVYRDDNHMTAAYARWLTPVIQADLAVQSAGLITPPTAGRAVRDAAAETASAG